jgi:hypothetical protein
LVSEIDGDCAIVTTASSTALVIVAPIGGSANACAALVTEPASTSAWVSV